MIGGIYLPRRGLIVSHVKLFDFRAIVAHDTRVAEWLEEVV
jgi:hypothetical protein